MDSFCLLACEKVQVKVEHFTELFLLTPNSTSGLASGYAYLLNLVQSSPSASLPCYAILCKVTSQ